MESKESYVRKTNCRNALNTHTHPQPILDKMLVHLLKIHSSKGESCNNSTVEEWSDYGVSQIRLRSWYCLLLAKQFKIPFITLLLVVLIL